MQLSLAEMANIKGTRNSINRENQGNQNSWYASRYNNSGYNSSEYGR